ncbi:uncharacterized protein A4U43_C07F22340 [Asparagus officinalis]|uniref:Uncharacterized protein n=1 Tax=Asparagus officinalis TaxID=4686 RepID=A0A5P1EDZ4_ASPOF|nr:pentatricopeptide repeat-containing protein At2g45350, chloroplastic [Asparagus officinalis]ONK64125.1 uncharacterized protein A4U43_C07F22340 [Asparagus officinalis]
MLFIASSHPSPLPLPLPLPPLSKFKTHHQTNQLHAHLITTGLTRNPSLSSNLILSLLSSPLSPHPHLAHRLFFSSLSTQTTHPQFLFNAILKSLSPLDSILTFSLMLSHNVPPNKFTLSIILKACSKSNSFEQGAMIHSFVIKSGLGSNIYLHNALVAFYAKCGCLEIARQVFDRIGVKDSVSWNSMIDGYLKSGRLEIAKGIFDGMRDGDRNLVTWNTMIGGYLLFRGDSRIGLAREMFDRMPERDSVSWNLMIDGYAKCRRMNDALELFEKMPQKNVISWATVIAGYMDIGSIDKALILFEEMPERDVVAWNIMLAGYVKNGKFIEALHLFNEMGKLSSLAPDCTTLAIVLSAISELGRIQDGIAVHKYIKRNRLPLNGKLSVGLIDMYSKCGRLEEALQVFAICRTSIDQWNAMICGLAIHGYGKLALKLFYEMERLSLKPDDITFIGVLNACSHSGLVNEGLMCFDIIRGKYRLEPKMQHYGCIVDILGRAGRLEEAWGLIEEMPFEPNDVIWKSLLSSCRKYGDFDMGLKIARVLTERSSCSSSSYLLLSHVYAEIGMWREARNVRMMMKERDMIKVPGCSWIELDGVMYEFVVGDNSHPSAKEAYSMLEHLCKFELYDSHSMYSIQQR